MPVIITTAYSGLLTSAIAAGTFHGRVCKADKALPTEIEIMLLVEAAASKMPSQPEDS